MFVTFDNKKINTSFVMQARLERAHGGPLDDPYVVTVTMADGKELVSTFATLAEAEKMLEKLTSAQ